MKLGDRIKERRLKLGLSIDVVATALNKNRATVYRYESNNISKLPSNIIEPLAQILQTTPAYLMGWTSEENPCEKEDILKCILQKLKDDSTFLKASKLLYELDSAQLESVVNLLSSFNQ